MNAHLRALSSRSDASTRAALGRIRACDSLGPTGHALSCGGVALEEVAARRGLAGPSDCLARYAPPGARGIRHALEPPAALELCHRIVARLSRFAALRGR